MPRKRVEYPANEELARVFCCFSPFLCLFVLLEGVQVPANEELARVFCCFSLFLCLFVLFEGMQYPANEELAHVSSRAYAHLTNKQTNDQTNEQTNKNTPNGVIEKIERKDGDDGKNFGRYFRSRFWIMQKYCFRSSMLERTSFLFEFSSLLILFFTLRKKSQLLSVGVCLLRIYFVTLRNEKPFSPFLPVNREPMRESSSLEYDIKTNYENEKIYSLPIIPNRSLDSYGTNRH